MYHGWLEYGLHRNNYLFPEILEIWKKSMYERGCKLQNSSLSKIFKIEFSLLIYSIGESALKKCNSLQRKSQVLLCIYDTVKCWFIRKTSGCSQRFFGILKKLIFWIRHTLEIQILKCMFKYIY